MSIEDTDSITLFLRGYGLMESRIREATINPGIIDLWREWPESGACVGTLEGLLGAVAYLHRHPVRALSAYRSMNEYDKANTRLDEQQPHLDEKL
jgi:hypothetical protein